MGTVIARKRKDGTIGYTVQIVKKEKGKRVYGEAKTFDREGPAKVWMKKREAQIAQPDFYIKSKLAMATLGDAIDMYTASSADDMGRTKLQTLRAIRADSIAEIACADIRADDIIAFARELRAKVQPQTVMNYLSHLAAVFTIARPAWGYGLDRQHMQDAFIVAKRMRLVSKSLERDRRPSLDELDTLLAHYTERQSRRPSLVPMTRIVPFALFSTRRQEEITRIRWDDYEPKNARVLVRDMKNPGEKRGNHVWCNLPDHAVTYLETMPRVAEQIFPYKGITISSSFTQACKLLGIENLHFHDLRHEGITRLFEMGHDIPHVSNVSGHRSWAALKRYTHIRQHGDKFDGWKWTDPAAVSNMAARTPPAE